MDERDYKAMNEGCQTDASKKFKHSDSLIEKIGLQVQGEYEMSGLAGDTIYMDFAKDVAKRYAEKMVQRQYIIDLAR